jgi:hypothetical protein
MAQLYQLIKLPEINNKTFVSSFIINMDFRIKISSFDK